jgi:hypothetical protein
LLTDPDYGTVFYQLQNQGISLDKTTNDAIFGAALKSGITKYIPDVNIINVSYGPSPLDFKRLEIIIEWTIKASGRSQQFGPVQPRLTSVTL